MRGMNNIALNNDVYEQFKSSCEQIKYEDPNIDIEEDSKRYVETLKIDDKSARESKLEAWISAKIQPKITQWKQKYSGANNLLNNIHTQINNMDKLLHTEQTNINNIQNQITSKLNNKSLQETELKNLEHDEVNTKNIDLPYEKKKAIIFVLFSIVIAFATYIYFVNNQISLKWATKTPTEKANIIIDLVRAGDIGDINYLLKENNDCFKDEDGKTIALNKIKKTIDFSCIDINKMENAPKPSLAQAFSEEPILFILAFSAFLLMLMGKVTSVVYERLKYPNWLFYLFYGLAGIVLISTVIVSSSLSSLQIEKNQIVKQISTMKVKINDVKKGYIDAHSYDEEYIDNPSIVNTLPAVQKIEKGIAKQEQKKQIVDEKISQYSFWISLLMMFTELVMGSLAWMTYSEYIKKKKEVENGGQGIIKKLKEEIENTSSDISKLEALILEKQKRINQAIDLQGKLSTLLGEIHTNEQIENMAQGFEQSIVANGKAMLQEAQMKWHKEQHE